MKIKQPAYRQRQVSILSVNPLVIFIVKSDDSDDSVRV